MRAITAIVLFFLNIININAQTLEWITSGAGDYIYSNNDIGYSVVSNNDFVYISGYVAGNNVKIQDTTILHGNFSFIAKYDKTGDLKWLKEVDGEEVTPVILNSKGEVYTTCIKWDLEIHLLKYDENGEMLRDITINFINRITSINVDNHDNLLLTGQYSNIDSIIIQDSIIYNLSPNGTNSFIMKLNAHDNFEWFKTTNITTNFGGHVVFNDIETDSNGDIIVIGDYALYEENTNLKFGEFYLNTVSNPAYGQHFFHHRNTILAKLDSKGIVLWAKKFGGYRDDYGNRIAVNNLNEIFIVGNFTDSISFNSFNLTTLGVDIYLSKVSTTGSIEWANKLGSNSGNSTHEAGRTVSVDENYVFVGGMYDGRYFYFESTNYEDTVITVASNIRAGFLAKYSLDGNFIDVYNLKTEIIQNVETAKIEDINISNDKIYVTGNFYPPSTFFNTTMPLKYNNTNHFFLASLNKNSETHITKIPNYNIALYPNPSNEYVDIYLENVKCTSCFINIYDIQGNLQKSKRVEMNNPRIDISNLDSGIYIIKISDNEILLKIEKLLVE
ncbi:MAG: T9SS type A sorting domain-containing protein [Salinivirgaceae bacterium]